MPALPRSSFGLPFALSILSSCAHPSAATPLGGDDATSRAPGNRAHSAPSATATLLGSHREIAMVALTLPAESTFELPNDGCQEAMVVVREGRVGVVVSGAPPVVLDAEAAARLPMGAGVPGRLEAIEDSRAFVVLARTIDRAFEDDASLDEVLAAPGECRAAADAPRVFVAPAGTTGPFLQANGTLRAYVHLDMPRHQAGLASVGYLDGDATVVVPEHGHDGSAEVLYFESGEGTMRLGDTTLTIGPGRFVYVPAGVRHGLVPTGNAPLRALQVYTPSGPEQRFRPLR